ncbi:MAG: hypothetical protein ACJA2S_001913 [Cyclobacteriaceae bacterium]|jgi:hypothetical protein
MLVLGVALTVLGIYLVFFEYESWSLSDTTLIVQGLFFIVLWYLNAKRHKFHLKIDERTINYSVFGENGNLPISEIKDIKVNLFEVQIESASHDKIHLNIEHVKDFELKKIKNFFTELKKTTSNEKVNTKMA